MPQQNKVCVICSCTYGTHIMSQKMCSLKCKKIHTDIRIQKKLTEKTRYMCTICKSFFYTRMTNKRTCSKECKYKRIEKLAHESRGMGRFSWRFKILERDGFRCGYCGATADNTSLQIDHVYPRSKGGKDIDANYITACWECNIGKLDKVLPRDRESEILSKISKRIEKYNKEKNTL